MIFGADEWLALVAAFVLLMIAGAWHLGGILTIRALIQAAGLRRYFAVLTAFWGLALLHLSEIIIGAFVYGAAIGWLELGSVTQGYGDSAAGLLYLSGVTFATLGYTEQVLDGPLRLMSMMHSLAGFMLITWSATYVYTIWGENFRENSG